MNYSPTTGFWRSAAELSFGVTALALLTLVCFQLELTLATTAFAYLILIVLLSLMGSFLPLVALSIIALGCLQYFFAPPIFDFRISAQDVPVVGAFLITSLVVTSLVRRARALQAQLQLVVDTIPAVVWSKSPDGSADFLNRRFRDYTGLSTEEGRGWGWMNALHPEDRAVDEWRRALAAGEPFEKEARLRRADGEYRWFVLRAVPLRDAQGHIVKWYGTSTDVDDQKRAEELLRAQARLLDLTHDTVFVRDMNDVITYWNHGAEELYGWKSEQAVGEVTHHLLQTSFPEPLEEIATTLRRTRRWEGELVHTKRDGTHVVVASRWALQLDEEGNPIAILETNNDITERKRAEDALRQHADLLEQTHDAIIVWNFPGTIVYWNRGAQHLYGFAKEEAIGRLTHDLLRTEHPMPTAAFEARLARQHIWSGEMTHTTRDGRKVIVDSRHVLVEVAKGRRVVLETNRDITDRKRAEYLTGQVFESSPDAVSIVGRDYRYQQVNPVFERYWGIPAERILGMQVADLMGGDVFEQIAKPRLDLCFDGEEVSYAGWFAVALERRYMAVTCSPLRPHSERVEAALVIGHDLTEHVLASEALHEAQAALAHVSRVTTLGEVTASLAHELNQPLAAIVNNANACLGLLPGGSHDVDEVREALADIVSDGERGSAIIERVRGLAKRSPPERVPLRLVDVVDDVVALASAESVARGVAIRTHVAGDLPVVLGDRVQLQQVLLNLLVNGMDAMSTVAENERLLEIRGRPDSQDGSPAVRISVQDLGIGLESGQLERLFEAFYTTKPHGMGMGLGISRSIIDAHGGRLWAEANQGPGATFSFSLPAAAPSGASRPSRTDR
jgi:PAS domain S-box-containing protein